MATRAHVLIATDNVLKAFFDAAAIAALADRVVRQKESADKSLPVFICASANAKRGRAKNWKVTGSLILKTDITDEDGNVTDAAKEDSDALELAVLDAIEDLVPGDDRPQPVGAAMTAAAVAADVINANEYSMTDFMITDVSAGFDEDALWTFSVDFAATVIA